MPGDAISIPKRARKLSCFRRRRVVELPQQLGVCRGDANMRRKDREIRDVQTIFDMLIRCDTIRIGFHGEPYPYIVPVSFGAEMEGDRPAIYFHCARQGMKLDLLAENPHVCVEGDTFIRTEPTDHGITTRYESVIGFGVCRLLADEEEILRGLKLLTEHYGYHNYSLERCRGVKNVFVGKIALDEITGKRNLPGPPPADPENA